MSESLQNPESAGIKAGLPPEPAPATGAPIVYQPISGWAIAGLAAGVLFALLVLTSAAVGLFQGAPVFFPLWVVGAPILAMILCLIGQRHVQNSEGTRAGIPLARWGFRISLVSGLTYFAYYFMTGLAVQTQANAFMMEKGDDGGFFQLLREGADNPTHLNAAFLLTVPATTRSGRADNEITMRQNYDQPGKDGQPGRLTGFREGLFGRVLYKQLAKDAEITPLAVRYWGYEKRGYKVHREYRVVTKEAELRLMMSAVSTEGESTGQGRRWFVNLNDPQVGEGLLSTKLTPVGEGVKRLRGRAREWLEQRLKSIQDGSDPFPDIRHIDQTQWSQVLGEKDLLHLAFTTGGKKRIAEAVVLTKPEEIGKWEQVDGKIRIHLAFRMAVVKVPDAAQPTGFSVDGSAAIESKGPINPERYVPGSPEPNWRLVNVAFVTVTGMSQQTRPK